MFNERNFNGAIGKFEKCLQHPKFNSDFMLSLYGQALCATGRLKEGHKYLLKACESYENKDWILKNQSGKDVAKDSLRALEHCCKHLGTTEGNEYLGKNQIIKEE